MGETSEILDRAKKRAEEAHLLYTGLVTPEESSVLLEKNEHAVLVDVRTHAELEFVGKILGAVHIEWASYPGMRINSGFSKLLEKQVDKEALVIFVCRTGGRSHNAATLAATLGFSEAYNMLEGFEGDANTEMQRTQINGWRHAGLPWSN